MLKLCALCVFALSVGADAVHYCTAVCYVLHQFRLKWWKCIAKMLVVDLVIIIYRPLKAHTATQHRERALDFLTHVFGFAWQIFIHFYNVFRKLCSIKPTELWIFISWFQLNAIKHCSPWQKIQLEIVDCMSYFFFLSIFMLFPALLLRPALFRIYP